jgi:hypothetical protein
VNERTGEAFEFDTRLTVVGNKLQPDYAAAVASVRAAVAKQRSSNQMRSNSPRYWQGMEYPCRHRGRWKDITESLPAVTGRVS